MTSEQLLLLHVVAALGRSPEGAWSRGLLGANEGIPANFKDDGCTWWFDSLFAYNFTDVCRVHDWAYCTRCQPPGSMTYANMGRVNRALSSEIAWRLPWWLDWTAGLVYRGVYLFGPFNAYDSCGPEAGALCRHNMAPPPWMMPGGRARRSESAKDAGELGDSSRYRPDNPIVPPPVLQHAAPLPPAKEER